MAENAIAEALEDLKTLKIEKKVQESLRIQILELNTELQSSLMMLELKKSEELLRANNYFLNLKLLMASQYQTKLVDFCKQAYD
jgi:hypothetical protein